jgi:signal transduction histidine kinase
LNERLTDMLGVLAHEMRTPIAAILGYQELLAEGIFGEIDERGHEPLGRIAYSAKQLLYLIDGVQEVLSPPNKRLEFKPETFDPAPALQTCVHNATTDAHGRNVYLAQNEVGELPLLHGDPERFCRAIDLALSAAIKVSHGSTIYVNAEPTDGAVQIRISGTGLVAGRDDPSTVDLRDRTSRPLTGAGLRLAIVRHLAQQMNGELDLGTDGTLRIKINPGPRPETSPQ